MTKGSPSRPRNGYGDASGGKRSDWREFVQEIKGIHNDDQEGNTVLHTAIQRGADRETLQHLINTSRNLETTNNVIPCPPSHLAAWAGHREIVEMLLGAGVDSCARTKSGKGPLHMAAWMGHPAVARMIVEHDRRALTMKDKTGETPLHWAAWRGKVRTIEELINMGADVEEQDDFGMTPLLLASQGGKHRAIGRLMDRGANIYAVDKDGESALHWSVEKGYLKATVELLGRGAHVEAMDNRQRTPIHLGAQGGHYHPVSELIRRNADVNATDKARLTPLHLAALGGHRDVVRLLLDNGANIRAKDEDGMTPLHLASWAGKRVVVEDLLRKGADAEKKSERGRQAPLHLAAKSGHVGAAEALLARGAYPDVTNADESTPLHLAAKRGHLPVVVALIEAKPSISPVNANGNTPLDLAIQGNHHETAAVLMSHGAKVNKSAEPAPKSPPVHSVLSPPRRPPSPLRHHPAAAISPTKSVSTQIHEDHSPSLLRPARSPSPPQAHPLPGHYSPRRYYSPSPPRGRSLTRHASPGNGDDDDICPTCGSPSPPRGGGNEGSRLTPRPPIPGVRSPPRPGSPPRRAHPGVPIPGGRHGQQKRSPSPRRAPGAPRTAGSPSPPRRGRSPARSASPPPRYSSPPRAAGAAPSWTSGMSKAVVRGLPHYTMPQLEAATANFGEHNVLGESDDGVTYYGNLDGNKHVAVRVLNPYKPEIGARFEHQVMVMATAPAPQLSAVVGICPEEYCIVYDYAPGASLDQRLAGSNGEEPLTWKERIKLANDIAAGLCHLHTCCPEPILHSNLVPSSVLLDQHLGGKLAGVSRACLASEAAHSAATSDGHRPSVEADVAALGLLLLQLITGDSGPDTEAMICDVEDALEEDRLLRVVDINAGNWPRHALTSYVELALSCLRATAYSPQLATVVVPKLKRMMEIYSTSMPTVDGHIVPTYNLKWQPTPGEPTPSDDLAALRRSSPKRYGL